jgi:outer membrane protein OmpA-like peptidoglycan-associated protein
VVVVKALTLHKIIFLVVACIMLSACISDETSSDTNNSQLPPQERTLYQHLEHYFTDTRMYVSKEEQKIILRKSAYFLFGTGSSLKPRTQRQLTYLAGKLTKAGYCKIEVAGYTDNVGSLFDNDLKSTGWAKKVYDYLRQQGIGKSITYKGYGEFEPISSNFTYAGRQENQRVEIIIYTSGCLQLS